ncbi:MAG: tetratricopeptide repeat protein, partial [Ignavibacteriales bacterium]|nr:tetratricopeptide repeat protein [Ignavibacteriales bacterium]
MKVTFNLVLFFLITLVWCQEDTTKIYIFSTENRLRFGNHLYSDGDYLRAYREYQEVLRLTNNDSVRFKLSVCLSQMGRYNEAADNFKTVFFNSPYEDEAKWEFYKVNYLMGDYTQFRDLCEQPMYFSEKYKRNIFKLKNYSLLYENIYLTDSTDF